MRLLVFIGQGADVRIPPLRDPRSGRVREEWLVGGVDPASARALDLALALKSSRPDAEITVMHLGSPESEPWLMQALARGCDRAVRVWDGEATIAAEYGGGGGAAQAGPAGRALILAAAARAAGYEMVLAGDQGVIGCDGRFGVLLAAELGVPCVTRAVALTARLGDEAAERRVQISRSLGEGSVERVEARLPVVVTAAAGDAGSGVPPTPVTARALLDARRQEIVVWGLAELGVSRDEVSRADRTVVCGRPRPRRPRLRAIAPPDQTLPAFDRILKLVEGSVRHREGRVVRQPAELVADEIFLTLRDEGWLDHLRPGPAAPPPEGPGGASLRRSDDPHVPVDGGDRS